MKRHEFKNSSAWHNRGYLPHYDEANKYQMITYRLADSLPKQVLSEIANELSRNADHLVEKPRSNKLSPGIAELLLGINSRKNFPALFSPRWQPQPAVKRSS